jgi:hypothetical protein
MVAEVRRIAGTMRVVKDRAILHAAASFIESLDREIQTVAEIGHKLMTAQETSECSPRDAGAK